MTIYRTWSIFSKIGISSVFLKKLIKHDFLNFQCAPLVRQSEAASSKSSILVQDCCSSSLDDGAGNREHLRSEIEKLELRLFKSCLLRGFSNSQTGIVNRMVKWTLLKSFYCKERTRATLLQSTLQIRSFRSHYSAERQWESCLLDACDEWRGHSRSSGSEQVDKFEIGSLKKAIHRFLRGISSFYWRGALSQKCTSFGAPYGPTNLWSINCKALMIETTFCVCFLW